MRYLIAAVLAVATILQGCSMKGYNEQNATQEVMAKVRSDFYDASLHVLYQGSHGEWKITNLNPSRAGKTYRATLTNATYSVSYVGFSIARNEKIRDVSFKHSRFYPVQKEEVQPSVQSQSVASYDPYEEAHRLAEQIAAEKARQLQSKHEQDLQAAKWEMRKEYDQKVASLRYTARALDDLGRVISNYTSSTVHGGRTVSEWKRINHHTIAKNLDLFRELLMFLTMNSRTAGDVRHYQSIGESVNVRFTLYDAYSCEYPNLTGLPGYPIVKPNRDAIRSHFGEPIDDSHGNLVYSQFVFEFDQNNLSKASIVE